MKIVGLSKKHCPKCEWAKARIVFPIEWWDVDEDDEAKRLVRDYEINFVPHFFIIDSDGYVIKDTSSVLELSKLFQRKT